MSGYVCENTSDERDFSRFPFPRVRRPDGKTRFGGIPDRGILSRIFIAKQSHQVIENKKERPIIEQNNPKFGHPSLGRFESRGAPLKPWAKCASFGKRVPVLVDP